MQMDRRPYGNEISPQIDLKYLPPKIVDKVLQTYFLIMFTVRFVYSCHFYKYSQGA